MQRKQYMPALADDEIPTIEPYGFAIAETDTATLDEGTRKQREHLRRGRAEGMACDAQEADGELCGARFRVPLRNRSRS